MYAIALFNVTPSSRWFSQPGTTGEPKVLTLPPSAHPCSLASSRDGTADSNSQVSWGCFEPDQATSRLLKNPASLGGLVPNNERSSSTSAGERLPEAGSNCRAKVYHRISEQCKNAPGDCIMVESPGLGLTSKSVPRKALLDNIHPYTSPSLPVSKSLPKRGLQPNSTVLDRRSNIL